MGHLCEPGLTDRSIHVLKNTPDHFLQRTRCFQKKGGEDRAPFAVIPSAVGVLQRAQTEVTV